MQSPDHELRFASTHQAAIWLSQRHFLLLHAGALLPSLEEAIPPGDDLLCWRDQLRRQPGVCTGKFLRGRSSLLSVQSFIEARAAVQASEDSVEWRRFMAGEDVPRPTLARWERRFLVARDFAGRAQPATRLWPELCRHADNMDREEARRRLAARFAVVALAVDDKCLVSYLGWERRGARRVLKELRGRDLIRPAGQGYRKGSFLSQTEKIREYLVVRQD